MGNYCCPSTKQSIDQYALMEMPQEWYQQPDLPTQCDICATLLTEKVSMPCHHSFHQECLQAHFQTLIQKGQLEMSCPYKCGEYLNYQQIKKLIKKVNTFSLYEKNLFQNIISKSQQYFFCPTPSCTGKFQIATQDVQYFYCQICNKSYCVICKREQHGDKDCNFVETMIKAGMKPCPYCRIYVERIDGCNAIKCKCGNQFCYDCGGIRCPHGMCLQKQKKRKND